MDSTKPNNTSKRQKNGADMATVIYGKVPPQAKDIEEAILGAIMLEKDGFDRASELIRPECFYVEAHQRIFKAMQSLVNKTQPIDIHTVVEELKCKEELEMVGGAYYVHKLTNTVVSAANIESHCRIVYQKFIKRELIRIGGEMVYEAYDESTDPFELKDQSEKKLSEIASANANIKDLASVAVGRFQRIRELMSIDSHITGIPSGFFHLDKITHGWQNTDLIILAARPAVGKTCFALNLARNAVKQPLPNGKRVKVALFSLEMSTGQLVDRMISTESEVPLDKIITGQVDDAMLRRIYANGIQPFADMDIYIDDSAAINVYGLRRKFRWMKRTFGSPNDQWLIILDYLQLMSGLNDRRNTNRENEISTISRNLKAIAKEENLPFIALSQLSRAVETRAGEKKVPVLSDLRESGAIEQDADAVLFMYRPDYYEANSTNEIGESTAGLTEISIAKNRNGSLAQGSHAIKLRAMLHIQKFVNWDGGIPIAAADCWKPLRNADDQELF